MDPKVFYNNHRDFYSDEYQLARATERALGMRIPQGVTEFDDDLRVIGLLILHGALTWEEAAEECEALSLRLTDWMADQMAPEDFEPSADEPAMVLRFSAGPIEPVFCELALAA